MGLTTERGSAADGFEAVPVPLASGEATENGGAMLRRRSALPSRRSVLYLHCRPDTFVPEDLVGWYTERGFHFYVADLRPQEGQRADRSSAGRLARLDAASRCLREAEGHDMIILIADSADAMKRTRGRRGLEVLAKLQETVSLDIIDVDYSDLGGVDAKLVRLARERGAKLVTNDFNLNRVAHVEGVAVLNINELAGAVKPVVLPGEELHVTIVRDGKESHQGVGYLDDGTMIVVENGRRLMGEDTDVQVTSVLQTVAGRMIFAKIKTKQQLSPS